MKNLLLFGVLLLTACSTASGPEIHASKSQSLIYLSSRRPAAYISSCLQRRLPATRASNVSGATELRVGSSSQHAWRVTLTPSARGSTVEVQNPAGSPEGVAEPEMRFAVARCTL